MASYKVKCKDYCDDYALHDVINYITQIYKTPHRMIGVYGVRPGNAAMQMKFVARAYNKYTGQRLRHSILSFSENDHVTLEQAYIIADAAARFYKDLYQIIFAIHEDTDNLHVHFVMNQVSYITGCKYRGSKKDYFEFIKYLNNVCRMYGIKLITVKDNEE